jgi:hypothetical protein
MDRNILTEYMFSPKKYNKLMLFMTSLKKSTTYLAENIKLS